MHNTVYHVLSTVYTRVSCKILLYELVVKIRGSYNIYIYIYIILASIIYVLWIQCIILLLHVV